MLAGVAAVGVDANRPMITPDIATWAIRMVTWSNDSWASKMRYVARGESYAEKNSLRIEAVISQPQKYINQKMTSHQRIAIKNGDIVGCTDAHENTCFFKKSFD
jgi:hypothetical protein